MPSDDQVLLHGQIAKDTAAFHHLEDAHANDFLRRGLVNSLPLEN